MNTPTIKTSVDTAVIRRALYISAQHQFDPQVVTQSLSIEPNYIWVQKHKNLMSVPNIPQMCWGVEFPEEPYWSTDAAINDTIAHFASKWSEIITFVSKFNLTTTIDILVHLYESNLKYDIVCEILPQTARKLSDINTTFRVTHYIHYDREDDQV